MSARISNTSDILAQRLGPIVLIAIALLGVVLLVSLPASKGFAQNTVILIQPPSSDVDVDDTITVDVRIEDVADLYGVDVRLSFDPMLLEVQDADGNPANGVQIQGGSFPAPDFVVKNEADNSTGIVWYAVSQMSPTEPISGTGVAASVTFKGLAVGVSSVAFTYQKIVRRSGEQIPAATQDGQITVVGTETSTPTPTNTPMDTPTPTPTPTGIPTSLISGSVWNDDNGDGVRDESESGIDGVTLDLYHDNNTDGVIDTGDTLIDTQTTDSDGVYLFPDLLPGDYIVDVTDTGNVLSDYEITTDNDPLAIHLEAGDKCTDVDFGYVGGPIYTVYLSIVLK